MAEIDKQYLGHLLLEQGFKTWFLYMFRVIEGRPFIQEPIHPEIFDLFEDIYNQDTLRANLNVPPRSAKTTMCKYFMVYALTQNPLCKFIYTSFNQNLLSDISKEVAGILENPIYKAMYPTTIQIEDIQENPIDDFWRNYLIQQEKKNIYTNRKISTNKGGEILFAAIGGQITGSGCGIRGSKKFSGALILDDANKPADIHSQTMRDKCLRYYEETLLSRLNDSSVAIINVQQRLHIEDLTGHLIRRYNFFTLRKPLIEINGECQIPSQYTAERIEELKFNDSMFQAQYQQEPVAEKGLIIKRDWWKYYDTEEKVNGQIIVTADTAFKVSKTSDCSCIQVWELRKDKMMMREMLVDRWEFPELIENAKMIWEKWHDPNKLNHAQYFFIEDKATGTPLQQTLLREGIEAIAWKPGDFEYPDDKVGRTKTMSWDIFRGLVYLPKDDPMSEYLVNESSLFAEDMSHSHDDACFVSTTMIATKHGDKPIEKIKIGDELITPFGTTKVTRTTNRLKPVINRIGLTGTHDHKVYAINDYSFDRLENMEYSNVSKLTYKGVLKWAIDQAYYSTETHSILTKRQDIMKLCTVMQQKNAKQKDFTELCMSFIQEKKFLKAFTFITKTAIKTITLWKTLSFYHIANMLKSMEKKLQKGGKDLKCKKQMLEAEKNVKNGMQAKRGENGIQNIKKNTLENTTLQKHVQIAEENSIHPMTTESKKYAEGVEINTLKENCERRVYNITTDRGCYYANGVLVSNCDAATMCHSIWKFYGGGSD